MFKGQTFYHSHVRKAVAAFGSIFNNIIIQRKDSSGNVVQSLRVPLAYATKQKFLSRIEGQPNLTDQEVALVLPRMGFEISSLTYDPTRKVLRTKKMVYKSSNKFYLFSILTLILQ